MKGIKKGYGVRLNLKGFVNVRQWLLNWITAASDFHPTILAVTIWHIDLGEQKQHPQW